MTVARMTMDAGESITCEVGAMVAMSGGITVETSARSKGKSGGGLVKGLKRMFAGENFFLNHFTANQPDQSLIIGASMLGDIIKHPLTGGTLIVQGSSWLASTSGIEVDATWQGLGKALFSGETAFWVKCSGRGDLILSSFGAIETLDIQAEHIVDTGHIVAFEDTLQFKVTKASKSIVGSLLGGEGFVCRFSGQGKLYVQSHNPPSFGESIGSKLKAR